jgi:hypothetical protein
VLPSIKAFLDTTLQETVFMPYVLPEHYFLPMEEGAPVSENSTAGK